MEDGMDQCAIYIALMQSDNPHEVVNTDTETFLTADKIKNDERFIAYGEIDGNMETIHVKNTGRCAELLVPGAVIYVQETDNPARKTKWDLIAVEKGDRLINMDSQIPNRVVQEWIGEGGLGEGVTLIRPETTYGNSRFDLYVEAGERKIYIFNEEESAPLAEYAIDSGPGYVEKVKVPDGAVFQRKWTNILDAEEGR